jgi:hypothetical protein
VDVNGAGSIIIIHAAALRLLQFRRSVSLSNPFGPLTCGKIAFKAIRISILVKKALAGKAAARLLWNSLLWRGILPRDS